MILKCGDCLDELSRIASGSVNLVLTSPPYNMNLRIRNGKYCSRQVVKELSTKYKNFDDNLTMDEYFKFNEKVINECLRVSDTVFYNLQILTGNKPAIYRLLGAFHNKIKELIVWDKINSQPAIGCNILNSQFEIIIVFQNSEPESRAFKTAQFERGTMSNHWQIKKGKKISNKHGAVFPVELADKIITSFTKKGDLILDPFMGTGTVGVSCKQNDRDFIGIEIDNDYYNFALNRINTILL